MTVTKKTIAIFLVLLCIAAIAIYWLSKPKPVIDNDIESKLVIDQCYRPDSCSSSKLISVTLIEKRNEDRLVEASLLGGDIVDPDNDNFSVTWDRPYTVFALCSKDKPRIAFKHGQGLSAEEFDLTNVPGVSVDSSSLYLGICHGTMLQQVRNNPTRFGYQALPDFGRGQFGISKPTELFE